MTRGTEGSAPVTLTCMRPAPGLPMPTAMGCGPDCACLRRRGSRGDHGVTVVTEIMASGATALDHADAPDSSGAGRVLLMDDPDLGRISASAAGLSHLAVRVFGWPLVALLAGAALGQTHGEVAGVIGAVAGAVLGVTAVRLDRAALTARLRLRRQLPGEA